MIEEYKTPASVVRDELKIRGSRFIGELHPVSTAGDAELILENCRKEYRDATHRCFAYRIGEDARLYRFSDDGEPAGTAGKPILSVLEHNDITNVLLIVIRYFGGTKLGTGGLVRAYSGMAQAVIGKGTIIRVPILRTIHITFPYDYTNGVMRVIAHYNVKIEDTEYGEDIAVRLAVRPSLVDSVCDAVTSATAGNIAIKRL